MQDGICLDGSAELSMSCMCMGNSCKYRGKLGPVHNADDQVYSVSKVQIFLNMNGHSLYISTCTDNTSNDHWQELPNNLHSRNN